jgi:hypothetical protein
MTGEYSFDVVHLSKATKYTVFRDFRSVIQDLNPTVLPGQKSHVDTGPFRNGYDAVNIWN